MSLEKHYEEALKITNELGIVKRLMNWAMAIDPYIGYPNMAVSLGREHFEFPEDNEEEFQELFIDALHTIIYFAKDEYWNLDNILNPDYTGGSENEPDPRITPEIEAWYDDELSWGVFNKLRGYGGEGVVS